MSDSFLYWITKLCIVIGQILHEIGLYQFIQSRQFSLFVENQIKYIAGRGGDRLGAGTSFSGTLQSSHFGENASTFLLANIIQFHQQFQFSIFHIWHESRPKWATSDLDWFRYFFIVSEACDQIINDLYNNNYLFFWNHCLKHCATCLTIGHQKVTGGAPVFQIRSVWFRQWTDKLNIVKIIVI